MNKTKTSIHTNQTSIEKSAAIIVAFTLIAMLGLSLAPASAFAESKDSNHTGTEKVTSHEDNQKVVKDASTSDKDVHFTKVSEPVKVKIVEEVKLTDHVATKKVEEVKESDQAKVHEQEDESKVKDNHNCEKKDKNIGGVVNTNDEPAMISIATTKTPAVLASTISVAKALPNTGLPTPLMALASAFMALGSMLTGFGLKLRKVSK